MHVHPARTYRSYDQHTHTKNKSAHSSCNIVLKKTKEALSTILHLLLTQTNPSSHLLSLLPSPHKHIAGTA
jgi:hypothetical protein